MRRLVLCLDPERALQSPCPVLFPEWGDEFRVIVPGLDANGWSECASAMSGADSARFPVLVWHLASSGGITNLQSATDTMTSTAPVSLRERLRRSDLVIAWFDSDALTPGAEYVALLLQYADTGDSKAVGDAILLPIAIRTLLDREKLLMAADLPARAIRRVVVQANAKSLTQAESAWTARLLGAKQNLDRQLLSESESGCEYQEIDADRYSQLDANYQATSIGSLVIHLFHRVRTDEQAIRDWFNACADQMAASVSTHASRLDQTSREAIARFAIAEPATRTSSPGRGSCEALRSRLQEELNTLNKQTQAAPSANDLLDEMRRDLARHRLRVLRSARRRPTRTLFITALLAGEVMIMVFGTISLETIQGAGRWIEIAIPAAIAMVVLATIAFGSALWLWSSTKRRVRHAVDALVKVRDRIAQAVTACVDAKGAMLRKMALGRNLAMLRLACRQRKNRLDQIESHDDALNRLLATSGSQLAAPVTLLGDIDVTIRPESTAEYCWSTDSPRLTIRLSNKEEGPDNQKLQPLLRRYAGVSRIEIECL